MLSQLGCNIYFGNTHIASRITRQARGTCSLAPRLPPYLHCPRRSSPCPVSLPPQSRLHIQIEFNSISAIVTKNSMKQVVNSAVGTVIIFLISDRHKRNEHMRRSKMFLDSRTLLWVWHHCISVIMPNKQTKHPLTILRTRYLFLLNMRSNIRFLI